jgi:ATP-dependent DNA ligase
VESWLLPMLCPSGGVDVPPEGEDWTYEAKIDGWRSACWITATNGVLMYGGRNGAEYTGKLPYIEQELQMLLPPDSAVDGELMGGAVGWGDVQGVMTRGDGPHVPTPAIPALSYVIFDVLRVNGTDVRGLPWSTRRTLLEQASWEFGTHVKLSPTIPAANGEAVLASLLDQGFEGLVAKRRSGRYINGRSGLWEKCKPNYTADAIIVGFKPGTGSLTGRVGAFEIELLDENDKPNGVRTRVKCGTQERHDDATAHPERWLNHTIEITHLGLGESTGKPRSPNFSRRRDDRTPAPARKRTASTPTSPRREVKRMDGSSGRNYGAMGDAKLLKCIRELRAAQGRRVQPRRGEGRVGRG